MTQRRGLGKGLGALIPTGGVRVAVVHSPDVSPDQLQPRDQVRSPAPSAESTAPAEDAAVIDLRDEAPPVAKPSADRSAGRNADGVATEPGADADAEPQLDYREIPLELVRPNPRQPRQVFDDEALTELAHSIGLIGLLQPVVVRPVPDGYELVAGERRLRATRMAGLQTIPALVRQTDDDGMLRDALLENLHRVQLNPLEEAAAYSQLMSDFSCTQDELAQRVGRSRPQVSNMLRLLKLPPSVQRRVAAGVLSAGHARAVLAAGSTEQMESLATRIVAEGLSVRAVEELVLVSDDGPDPKPRRRSARRSTPVEFRAAADRLADHLETRVTIDQGRSKGRITIEFADVADLARIIDLLSATAPA